MAAFGLWLHSQDRFVPFLEALFGGGGGGIPVSVSPNPVGTITGTGSGGTSAPASGISKIDQWDAYINSASAQTGVPAAIIKAVMMVESGGDPNQTNHNTNGTTDYGLMQINEAPSRGLSNPFDPAANILAGAQELQQDIAAYPGDLYDALRAYNAGIAGSRKHPGLSSGYAQKVLGWLQKFQ